jgi:hypothetical protein
MHYIQYLYLGHIYILIKVASLVGGVALLKAVGFVRNDEGTSLDMSDENLNLKLLSLTKDKLEAALAKYTA